MLSRRNIRIKVMQALYAASRDRELDKKTTEVAYRSGINASFELYIFHLFGFVSFLKVAQEDAKHRAAKHLPSEQDKAFTDKIYNNELISSLEQSDAIQHLVIKYQFDEALDRDVLRRIYKDYAATEDYITFIMHRNPTREVYIEQLLIAYKYLAKHELYIDHVEENYSCWVDDKSLILGTMKKTIKQLPVVTDFYHAYLPQSETVDDFGVKLLHHVLDEDESLLRIIEPVLENWDAKRVAILDMILLKMAICELMYFPTIPTKVTLNEFVELAKTYSTDKSKDFINGILDKLVKKLSKEGKIVKEGRGLVG